MTTPQPFAKQASELGNEAEESIEELGRSARRKLETARDETAGALHAAASSVRAAGREGSAAIDSVADGTAARLDATATSVEDYDLGDAFAGVRRFCRRHLTGSLVAAAAVGFVAGSFLSRAAYSLQKSEK